MDCLRLIMRPQPHTHMRRKKAVGGRITRREAGTRLKEVIFLYYTGNDFSASGHVGFVRYDSDGGTFDTVEGNSSNRVNTRTLNTASYTFVTPPWS